MSTERQDWKEKYAKLLDETDQQSKQQAQQISLLQRALVRSLLAAEGQDPRLDKSLKNLRGSVRKNLSSHELERLIDKFEIDLLAADEQRQAQHEKLRQSLRQLSDQLLQQQPAAAIRKALGNHQASLRLSLQNLENLNDTLHELGELQALVLDSRQKPDEPENASLLQRLFPSRQRQNEQPVILASTVESTPAAYVDDQLCPGLREQVKSTLLELLENLPVSSDNQAQADNLTQSISASNDCSELTEMIDALAALIIREHSYTRQDIESYLQQLNHRLGFVNESLQSTQSCFQSAMDVADSFESQVQSQVEVLNRDVQQSSDLQDLKLRVDYRVSEFISSVQAYQSRRKQADKDTLERFNALTERVLAMESEAQQLNNKLEEQQHKARVDFLTGIANRASLDERLTLEHARLARTGSSLLMAILDIDFFKRINDNYGHKAGDKVLKIIAGQINASIRKTDFFGRYGGEEFVMLLPDTELDHGQMLLDKIRLKIASMAFHFRGDPVQITFSAGIGQLHASESVEQAFSRIDNALYQAKNAGRNQIQRASQYQE